MADNEGDLSESGLSAAADNAVAAFAAASDLDALTIAKASHIGNKAPIALAQRALGTLPGSERSEERRVGKECLL